MKVIEIVTGFVQSNLLHHGLYAPDDSPYLPIQNVIEEIKYQGNKTGTKADEYARAVVGKLMSSSEDVEIWQGRLAWRLQFLTVACPQWFLV